jgi:ankyrin repeat protein
MKASPTNILVLTLFVSFIGLMFFGERLLDWVVAAPRGDELLFCGAGDGNVAVMERAFSQGATVDARSKATNTTPLMLACQTHHPEAVRLLLRRGADPNARADRDISPMYNAVLADDADAIVLLLRAGATTTEVHFGDTLLDVANRYDSPAAAAQLKQLGGRSGTLSH